MDWYDIIARLFAGLALFLFGLDQIGVALRSLAGDRLRALLRSLTRNRLAGAFSGAVITGILQSSSVTTVLLVGFISAGLMSLQQSVAVIFGANIGSTVTAQIIAFKVTELGMLMLAVGFGLLFAGRHQRLKQWGQLLMGLGLIFFGMDLMGEATQPLRSHQGFIDLMASMDNRLLGMLVGMVFTAVVQSSAATTGLAIVLASQVVPTAAGPQTMLSLEAGIAIALGANIGTCATALLAAIGKSRPAVRAALVHVLFNIVGTLIWIGFIGPLGELAGYFSPGSGPEAAARDIANAHTIFNVVNTLLFLPATGLFVLVAMRLVPERPTPAGALRPRHLDQSLLQSPGLALEALRMELLHLGEHVRAVVAAAPQAVARGDAAALTALQGRDDPVDLLHAACLEFARQLASGSLSTEQSRELSRCLGIANDLEGIADVVTTNLVASGRTRLLREVVISQQTMQHLQAFHRDVLTGLDDFLRALRESDAALAAQVRERKADLRAHHDALEAHLEQRLRADDPNRIHAYSVERDLLDNLYRIFSLTKRAAKSL